MVDLVLEEGAKLHFPVGPDHALAETQKLGRIESIDDVMDFEFVRLWAHFANVKRYSDEILGAFEKHAPNEVARARILAEKFERSESFLAWLHEFAPQLLKLQLGDFIVPAGATVTVSNSMTTIFANRVMITGTLRSEGHLAITAHELGG